MHKFCAAQSDAVVQVLGMWAAESEGAKFQLSILAELKNRGVQDDFIACVGGPQGFPEALEAAFPQAQVQLCLVHMVRHSLSYVSHKDVACDLKAIYRAAAFEEAERRLEEFAEKWDVVYPVIAKSRRLNWARVTPMFGYPEEIRRAIYTTNTIESLNSTPRKIIKNRPLIPSDEAVMKLLSLALRNVAERWAMPIKNWSAAMNQFAILFEGRVPMG